VKRQTLSFVLVLFVLAAVLVVASHVIRKAGSGMDASAGSTTVTVSGVSFTVPSGLSPVPERQQCEWTVREYKRPKFATLQIMTAPASGRSFESLIATYFGLDGLPASHVTKTVEGWRTFIKPVPIRQNGVYVVQNRAKTTMYTYFFLHDDLQYWLRFTTGVSFTSVKAVFDEILYSTRFAGGEGPRREFFDAVEAVPRDGLYLYCQPPELILGIPLIGALLVFLITKLVMIRAGRLPPLESFAGDPPSYTEEGVEIGIRMTGKLSYQDAALAVTSRGLTVYTYKTPYIFVPKGAEAIEITSGRDWLGAERLRIANLGCEVFQKRRWAYRLALRKFALTIYTRNIPLVHSLLS